MFKGTMILEPIHEEEAKPAKRKFRKIEKKFSAKPIEEQKEEIELWVESELTSYGVPDVTSKTKEIYINYDEEDLNMNAHSPMQSHLTNPLSLYNSVEDFRRPAQ